MIRLRQGNENNDDLIVEDDLMERERLGQGLETQMRLESRYVYFF
jgi:hypothetical protein